MKTVVKIFSFTILILVAVVRSTTMKATTKVLKNGRVTVPFQIRDRFKLEYGDYVEIDVRPVDGGSDA
jgi:AbrB family looped-hinge helix DNA binding protein